MSLYDLVPAHPSYCLEDAIREGIAAENACDHLDLGPVDTLDPETHEAELNRFFGTSPLSSPSPFPSPSRSASPQRTARDIKPCPGASRSPADSPWDDKKPPPVATLSAGAQFDDDHDGEDRLSKKARRRREKSHKNRGRKRKEARAQQDPNATPYPNRHKHYARAETTTTCYDTNDIPSASSGFVALSDVGDGTSKIHEARELLEGEAFKLIRWNGTYVPTPARQRLTEFY